MLQTTDAIVLSLQPHSDKAHILHAYTRAGGRVNYIVYGIGRKNPMGLYAPLSLIRITASHSSLQGGDGGRLPTLKEATILSPFTFHLSPHKSAIALFLAEVLYHVLRHPMQDEPMFDFIAEAVQMLDQTEEPQNFHLQFLAGLAAKLGFTIESSNPLSSFLGEDGGRLPSTRKDRQEALRALCAYFAEHVETWQIPRSLDVLMEVFD